VKDKEFSYILLYAWTIDFVRCVEEFSFLRKLLLRIILGKYASREYVGMRETMDLEMEESSQFGYGLENCDYHNNEWKWFYDQST